MESADEVEVRRQEALAERRQHEGDDWAERFEPGSFGCHELLDRVSVMMHQFETHVLEHDACLNNADWYARAEAIRARLFDLYQEIGSEHL